MTGLAAAPEIVEDQVTEPIENQLRSLDGVEELSSTSGEGVSTVRVAFDYGGETGELVSDIESAVNEVRPVQPGRERQSSGSAAASAPREWLAVF